MKPLAPYFFAGLLLGWLPLAAASEADQFFEAKIRPLLAAKCFECHRGGQVESGLHVDSRNGLLRGGDSGPAIVVGEPSDSLLIRAVSRTHDRLKMPPGQPLASHEVESLKQWIENGAAWPVSREEFFESRIQTVLRKSCVSCHGPSKRKGGLRLDSREAVLKGGDSGPAIVAGDAEKSLLIAAIRYQHDDLKMPPKEPLTRGVIKRFEKWIDDGAVWAQAADGPSAYVISQEQRDFWSFQPVSAPKVPMVAAARWKANPIDAFVLAELNRKSLSPGEPVGPGTLIRRTTFDLTGLPPSPEEVDSFEQDFARDADAAMRNLVERLLASPQYGERWGRHWLDLVRYADTAGDASDFPIPEAYKYRNYVIDAFNDDKPYDQFVREQIAGDLLPFENDDQRWQQTIATGYIAISRRIGVSPHGLRHITIEDTIDNLGKTFLGLTLACSRCHDHKFDPIPTTDYYALYGIFDSSTYPHAGAEHKPWRQDFVYRIGKEESDEVLRPFQENLEDWNLKERAKLEEYRDFQRKKITDPTQTRERAWKRVLALREQRRPHAEAFPDLEIAYAIQEGDAHDVYVQKGGDPSPNSSGPLVRRGFLRILGGEKLPDDASGSGRLELARWIANEDNPLTARVMANRIWHHHFGRGLVRTTSDFGVRGSAPTHPALLDFLASYFTGHGWSIKDMHRLMMLSQTYQLASRDIPANSAVDPENILLWRANRRRLDAEQIRDSLLTFSNELDDSPGGRHPFGHRLTYFYRQHEPFVAEFPTKRRSVYMMQQRIQKNAYLDLFDGPDGNVPLGRRRATTTTLQALFFMNSKLIHEQSQAIATRLLSRTSNPRNHVNWAYRMIFGRAASEFEIAQGEKYLEALQGQLARLEQDEEARRLQTWAAYVRGMLSSNEFLFVD